MVWFFTLIVYLSVSQTVQLHIGPYASQAICEAFRAQTAVYSPDAPKGFATTQCAQIP